jgi:hypothetical protein
MGDKRNKKMMLGSGKAKLEREIVSVIKINDAFTEPGRKSWSF